jgi:branched-chain amino acid transport system permease protein
MGVSTIKFKLLAFAMGAAVGCLSGALFAVQIGSIASASFTILVSITVLAVVILGGMGSIPGVVVGTLLLIGLPGLLDEFEEYRLLIYGAALILVMVLRPQGLVPNVRRMRIQVDEAARDQWLKKESPGGDRWRRWRSWRPAGGPRAGQALRWPERRRRCRPRRREGEILQRDR